MTRLEAKQALCEKLNISYTDVTNNQNGLFTATNLENSLDLALLRAWDLHPWDFTEGAKTSTTIDADYYDYPDTLVSGSVFYLVIGGKGFRKVLFKDYLKYLEDNPTGADLIFAEYNGYLFVNKNACSVGQVIDLYGKLKAPKLAADADLMPFSPISDNNEYSGNQAIVTLAYADILSSDKIKNPAQGQIEEKRGFDILNLLWKQFADNRSNDQVDQPFFNVPDFFGKGFNRSKIGNF